MRWFVRSAVAVAGLGSLTPLVLSQPETPAPMVPPVRSLPEEEEPPASGFTRALPPILPAPRAPVIVPAAAWVPDVSPAKPAPPEPVQNAVPAPLAPLAPPAVPPTLPVPALALPALPAAPIAPPPAPPDPDERPDRLPPFLPVAPPPPVTPPGVELPAPPAAETPLPIPVVPESAEPEASEPPAMPPAAPNAVAAPAAAPTARLAEVVSDPVWRALPQNSGVRVRGWLDAGIVYNSSYPDSKFNGPYNSVDRSAEPMFNQAYLILDRPRPADGSFGYGWRADVLFGYDAFLGQSRGFEVDRDFNKRWNGQYYGLAIPQVYAEVGSDLISLKVGHFYTIVGYETLPSVGNFFYSHAYSYQFGQPFTHWGGLVTAQLTRNWQGQMGFTNGWDALVGRANNVNFLGSLRYTPDVDWWWASFALVSGQDQNNVAGLPNIPGTDGNRTRYSFLFGLMPGGPCGRWEYVFHHYYGWQENGTPQGDFARWYGIDQYLYYRASRTVRLGARFEWFRDEDGTRVGLNRPSNPNKPPLPGNYFSSTFGLNYFPVPNFVMRPEIRWDFTSDTTRRAFNDGQKNGQLLMAMDLIWQF